MGNLTIKFIVITIVLLFSIPISSQNTISVTVVDSAIDSSQDLSTVLGEISLQGIGPDSFVSKWDTTKSGTSTSYQITLPIYDGGTYDFTIDWGDGSGIETITIYTQNTHTYSSEGEYTVVINGTLTGWQFDNGGDRLKILEIMQWGNIRLGNTGRYFYYCQNLVLTATDSLDLTGTTNLSFAFSNTNLGATGSMNAWDVSGVTDMKSMFASLLFFNQDIGSWGVSSVTNMTYMFKYSPSFNRDIGSWNVSSVTSMGSMFNYATSFNQHIGDWDVSNVISMYGMFDHANSFDQPLGNWDVSSVISMYYMFAFATLSPQNYDDLLNGWATLTLQPNIIFEGGSSKYTQAAVASRQYIIDTYTWSIADGGWTEITPPEVSSPDDFSYRLGPIGNVVEWSIGDVNPNYHFVYVDGNKISEGSWTNGTISVNIDFLKVGVHTVRIDVYDDYDNLVSDTVIVTVLETTPTEVSSPVDFSYKITSTGNQIAWILEGENTGVYNITRDGSLVVSTQAWDNGTYTLDIDNLGVGVYEFTIFVYDTYDNLVSDTVIVAVTEIDPPEVSNPIDLGHKYASTGNLIEWAIGDVNPWIYNVTLDGTLYTEGTWTNGTISVDIDGLSVGIHEFIIYVYDIDGNMVADTVIVSVTEIDPPYISSPENVSYEPGTNGNLIEWTVRDANPATYNSTIDGNLYEQGNWINGTISLDIDGLPVGVYIVILYIYDIYGYMTSDSVLVVVSEVSTDTPISETSTTSSETSTTTTEDGSTSESTDTTDAPIYFTFVVLGLAVFVLRRRQ